MELVLVLLLVIAVLVYLVYRRFVAPASIAHLPAPSWEFMKDFLITRMPLDERRLKHLDWSNLPMKRRFFFGTWEIVLNTPELARELYTQTDVYEKFLVGNDHPEMLYAKFFGVNLVFSNGLEWRKQHRIISPAFQTKNLIKIANTVFINCIRQLFDQKLSQIDSSPIDIHNWTQRLTLDVLGKAAFSFDLGSIEDEKAKYVTVYNECVKRLLDPILLFFPFISNLPFQSATGLKDNINTFDSLLYSIIDNRKKQSKEGKGAKEETAVDLLDLMLCSEELSSKELRDNLVIFFLAGHDTTANSLSTVTYFLARYPEIQNKARREVCEVYERSKQYPQALEDYIPNYEDQKSMDFITALIKEGLRLYPSVAILPGRKVASDATIGGVDVPKGTLITVSIFDMQRHPDVWGEDSEEFTPERFLAEDHPMAGIGHYINEKKRSKQPTRNDHPMAFNAFGASNRSCIGQQFSLIEQRMFLAVLLLRYDFSLPAGCEKLKLAGGGLLYPKGLLINFERRF